MTAQQSRLPRLLVVTDRAQLPLGRSLLSTVDSCLRAGLTHVVLRELDLPDGQRAALAAALTRVGAAVIAAHRPVPAAIGTHLPAGAAGTGLGRSCHSRRDVEEAAAEGSAYATLGPFAPSASKPGYGPALPPTELRGHEIPVYALGGVSESNAAELVGAGAYGVAVMGAVMRSGAPETVVRRLLEAVR
ncbi:thiamine phosphate synthase [Nocardioides aquiterrae]|uniref:Thiamine phosphate synthase n=1 Tax=Nocardioides aquiterrae TaxID=203799 RepID=A0ABN1U9E2_9ACTN